MIPFSHLGWVFKTFGSVIYPNAIRDSFCDFVHPLPSNAKVLDLGAGTGMMSEFAHACRSDLSYVALDPAEGMLKYSADYVETVQGYAEDIPFDDNSFHMVCMGESLHHFRDVELSIKETVRVLKKEGKLFIYDFDVNTFLGKNICRVEKLLGEPGNFFTPSVLKKILESHGFSVQIHQYNWRYTISAHLLKEKINPL